MLRALVRRFLPADPYSPSLFRACFSRPYRELKRLERVVRTATGGRVASGPFAGMRYTTHAVGSQLACKLAGTYEKELHPLVGRLIESAYPLVIDIGAAEGYYAVGLAMRLPTARVVAFEAVLEQHKTLLHMAQMNGVRERIEMRGLGTHQELTRLLAGGGRTLVICDIEGFEADLLDPAAAPGLRNAQLLVEVHDRVRPDVGDLLRERFGPSHQLEEIPTAERTLADWPAHVQGVSDDDKLKAMAEHRGGGMRWFWMQPLRSGATSG